MSLSSKIKKDRMVEIRNEGGSVTILKVTDVIKASDIEDPEIRSGSKENLSYIMEGFLKYSNNQHINDIMNSLKYRAKIMVYVYPDTIINIKI